MGAEAGLDVGPNEPSSEDLDRVASCEAMIREVCKIRLCCCFAVGINGKVCAALDGCAKTRSSSWPVVFAALQNAYRHTSQLQYLGSNQTIYETINQCTVSTD